MKNWRKMKERRRHWVDNHFKYKWHHHIQPEPILTYLKRDFNWRLISLKIKSCSLRYGNGHWHEERFLQAHWGIWWKEIPHSYRTLRWLCLYLEILWVLVRFNQLQRWGHSYKSLFRWYCNMYRKRVDLYLGSVFINMC